MKIEFVPRAAEKLDTCQKTFSVCAPPARITSVNGGLLLSRSVDPIWKMRNSIRIALRVESHVT